MGAGAESQGEIMAAVITYKFKMVFFDRKIVQRNWKKINRTPLQRSGMIVRSNARGSIRPRSAEPGKPKKPSPKGTPPRSWTIGSKKKSGGKGGRTKPKRSKTFKLIFSAPNRLGTSVVVGMIGFGKHRSMPGLHEHGGTASRKTFVTPRGSKGKRDKKGRFLKDQVVGRFPRRKTVRYAKRSFMQPALERAANENKLPHLWKGSLARAR